MIFSNQDRFSKLKKQKERAAEDETHYNPPSAVCEVSECVCSLVVPLCIVYAILSVIIGGALGAASLGSDFDRRTAIIFCTVFTLSWNVRY